LYMRDKGATFRKQKNQITDHQKEGLVLL
jgi:hypothetical protein